MACFHFWPSTKQTGKTPTKTGGKQAPLARARTCHFAPRARVCIGRASAIKAFISAADWPAGVPFNRRNFQACRSMAWGPVYHGREKWGVCRRRRGGAFFLINTKEQNMNIYIFKSQGRLILKPSIKSAGLGKYPQNIKTCGIQQRA